MLRVLVLASCAMTVLGLESYVSRIREIKMAEELLSKHLIEKEYKEVDKDLAYLLMVGAIFYPALELAKSKQKNLLNATELHTNSLRKIVHEVTENPNKLVRELKDLVRRDALALEPLTSYVYKTCLVVDDDKCNELLNVCRSDLAKSVSAVLDKSYDAALVFLRKNRELEELAESPKFMSYLFNNPDVENHVSVIADWLSALHEAVP